MEESKDKELLKRTFISRETKILMLLQKNPKGLSARQLAYMLGYTERNATAPRLTKMKKIGQVISAGKVKDMITKKSVTIYKLRGNDDEQ